MTVQQQRFCPICDRSFTEAEAVLRCEGCGVLHHPGCWVRNDGCVTQESHKTTPIAQAYASVRQPEGATPHPGEGTRVYGRGTPRIGTIPPPPLADFPSRNPIPFGAVERGSRNAADDYENIDDDEGPVIGAPPPPPRRTRPIVTDGPPPPPGQRPTPPRRYQGPAEGGSGRAPMPRIYREHRILGYWYIPAAVLVAVVVAFGVIWTVEKLAGGGGDNEPAAVTTTGPGLTPLPTTSGQGQATQPAGQATPSGTTTPAPGTGKFNSGDKVVVTGAGDCLNVRTAPGRSNPAIVCLKDGTIISVSSGPESADELKWWKVKTELGEGWAAEDYLAKTP